jgi:hypothetical protein
MRALRLRDELHDWRPPRRQADDIAPRAPLARAADIMVLSKSIHEFEAHRLYDASRALFIAACLLGAWAFWRRRRIDPFLLGFAACLFYFAPGLIGRIDVGYIPYHADIAPQAYGVMTVVVLITTAAAWCIDRVPIGTPLAVRVRYVPHVLLAITLGAATVSVFTVGQAYFCDKAAMLPSIDRWYYIAAYVAPLCFATAAAERAWAVLLAAAMALLADCVIGFRAGAAIALMATAMCYGAQCVGTPRLLLRFGLLVAVAAVLLMAVREVTVQAKYPLQALCARPAVEPAALPEFLDAAPRTRAGQPIVEHPPRPRFSANLLARLLGEPQVIQASLNEIVRREFTTGRAYLFDQLKSAIPGAALVFGIQPAEVRTFNLIYQPALFPTALSGMASNPWAQAYAAGGFGMVALFAAGYAAGLAVLTLLFRRTRASGQAMVGVMAAWWGFYAHRNDLLIQIGIMKMVVYIAAAALTLGWLLQRLTPAALPCRGATGEEGSG